MALKKEVKKVEEVKAEPIKIVTEGPLCDCGKPVAPGQNQVCKDHIRVG